MKAGCLWRPRMDVARQLGKRTAPGPGASAMDRSSLMSRSWPAFGAMIALCLVAPVTNPITDSGMLGYTRPVVFALWGAGVILLQLRAPDTEAFTRRSCVLAVTGLALLALQYFQTAIEVIRFPYALEWEGYAYKAAWLLANGRPIYHPWDNPVGGGDAVYSPGMYVVWRCCRSSVCGHGSPLRHCARRLALAVRPSCPWV
jgi:hypothetical protein